MNQIDQSTVISDAKLEAFKFLKALPPYKHKGDRSMVIDATTAQGFTDKFRGTTDVFTIPVSWNIDKQALINLLGITSCEGQEAISGIRLYAGINDNNQLTLVAVTTEDANNATNDLTIDDQYPYYDYANPCPNNCSSTGNLKAANISLSAFMFSRIQS